MSKISVIVPVYNVERYLKRCIDSILSQTFSDIEIILVDDGSTDSCPKICDEYAAQHTQIVVIHKENGGVSAARNEALKAVTGDYLTFCDSDDFLEKDWLEVLYSAINESNVDCVNAGYKCVGEEYEILGEKRRDVGKHSFQTLEEKVEFLSNKIISNSLGWEVTTRLFKSNIIRDNNIRFCESCGNFAEDLGFTVEYTLCSCSAQSINYLGYCYFQRNNSMMHKSVDEVKLDSVNEISLWAGKSFFPLAKSKKEKKWFSIIHFLIMNCQYYKVINSDKYPFLAKEINRIKNINWYRNHTKNIFTCYSKMKELFGKENSRKILLFSNYCLHGNWKRFVWESTIFYKVIIKL